MMRFNSSIYFLSLAHYETTCIQGALESGIRAAASVFRSLDDKFLNKFDSIGKCPSPFTSHQIFSFRSYILQC